MKKFLTLLKYEVFNVFRSRWLVAYALLFGGISQALLQFASDSSKAVVSLMSIVLLVVPVVSALYASVYWYSSEGFTSLLLTQPIARNRIYLARWVAISLALSSAFVLGEVIPLAINSALDPKSWLLVGMGAVLSFIFTALGLLVSVWVPDRMKGIGAAFMAWFYFAIVHDAIVFLIVAAFHEYPLEVPSMAFTAVNPIDLARLSLLLSLDFSALMGYTGTILQKTLAGSAGVVLTIAALTAWLLVPVGLGVWRFRSRDF